MRNEFYFQIEVASEQIEYANLLVDYSLDHHSVPDIFASDPNSNERQREFRFTRTLGEVLFAIFNGRINRLGQLMVKILG